MNEKELKSYNQIRTGGTGSIELPRGLFAVWGKEAVQFLDGMVTNDMKTLADGGQMMAAFPSAQGRLLAVVRILRQADRFLIETEEATREKIFSNLFRFTHAGDFFVEDLSASYRYSEVFRKETPTLATGFFYSSAVSTGCFIPNEKADDFGDALAASGAVKVSEDLYETLRIESGVPKFGIDMDENTIVPELGLDDMISYTKGCYIGQEIIARIHFRGHVAKRLAGLIFDEPDGKQAETRPSGSVPQPGSELTTAEGKNAGRLASVVYSPKRGANIALAFVRYDYLAEGTELKVDDAAAAVSKLPFVT